MDLWSRIFLCIVAASPLYSRIDASCGLENRISNCEYSLVCYSRVSAFFDPDCDDYSVPNITFILTGFKSRSLSNDYLYETRSSFDIKVRTFKGNNNEWLTVDEFALKFYRNLESVDLSQNRLQAVENYAFGRLNSLLHLNLSNNQIPYINPYSLKITEPHNSRLETLDLSNNMIKSLEKNMFTQNPNLINLYLRNNQIMTLHDSCFDSLRNLKVLILENNKIIITNMTLVTLRQLEVLDMSNNFVNKVSSSELISCTKLVSLNLSHNNIETIDPGSFGQLFELRALDLSNNDLSISLEETMFKNSSHLESLILYRNNITILSSRAFARNSLNYLNLNDNNIKGDLTSNVLEGLSQLTSFEIPYQRIEAIRNYSFSNMANLKYLNLSHNFIDTVENSSFVNASSLCIFDVSFNKIESLYFFKMFSSNLTEIYINDNNLRIVPKDVFKNHISLKKLDISNNAIVSIADNSLPLNNLVDFNMKGNILYGVLNRNVLSPAKYLRDLDISGNQLKKINNSALINMPFVVQTNLSHNNLDFIHPNNFENFDSLFTIDLSYNNFTSIELKTQLRNLSVIQLNNNELVRIPNIFGNNSKLQNLDISHNKLSNVTDPTIGNLKQIKVLFMADNNLTSFNNIYTNSLQNLTELSLASNKLKEMVNITYFQDLMNINLRDNEISYINSSHFGTINSLIILTLKGNKIKILNPGIFQHLNWLRVIDLSSNLISDVRFGSFRGLNNTILFSLVRNRIKNINVEVFHECSELRDLYIDYNNISTIDVDGLVTAVPNLVTLSIGGNPIACHEVIQSKRKNHNITLTSMHKIYHEDNVHGIKCGSNINLTNNEDSTTIKPSNTGATAGNSTAYFTLIWIGILGGLLTVGFVTFYCTKRKINRDSSSKIRFQNSTITVNSEFDNVLS